MSDPNDWPEHVNIGERTQMTDQLRDEMRSLLEDSAGEDFLPPGWQRVVKAIPALLAQLDSALTENRELRAALEGLLSAAFVEGEDYRTHNGIPMAAPFRARLAARKARKALALQDSDTGEAAPC